MGQNTLVVCFFPQFFLACGMCPLESVASAHTSNYILHYSTKKDQLFKMKCLMSVIDDNYYAFEV